MIRDLPILTADEDTRAAVAASLRGVDGCPAPVFFDDPEPFLEFVSCETPAVIVIDFAEGDDRFAVLDRIGEDHWLHCSGVVGLYGGKEGAFLDRAKTANLVAAVAAKDVAAGLPTVMRIIARHGNILFQREMQDRFTGETSGRFEIANDPLEASVHANLLANYVYNLDRVDTGGKMRLRYVLQELLLNGIEHGNCGITFEEKTRFTSEGIFLKGIIRRKMADDPSIRGKRVRCGYEIKPDRTRVTVTDEGTGFDWRAMLARLDAQGDEASALFHGRGIMLSREYVASLEYNEAGNRVTFIFAHEKADGYKVPALFERDAETRVAPGDVIFEKGEESNFLYYIAAGRYRVTDEQAAELAVLTPNDLFIGEMAFLLNNRRTAGVEALEEGVLYRISKRNFIAAIKKYPYYSFLLCKLLARRLAAMGGEG